MFLGEDIYPGDILTDKQLAGRDPNILIRFKLAEYFQGEIPAYNPPPKTTKAETPVVKIEEAAPVIEEAKSVKAIVEKRGVWHQVFVNDKKVFHSRDEKEATKFAKDFNAKL